jgi:hypothetical protein
MDDPSKYPSVHTYDECAFQIYNDTKLTGHPGKTYSYNSVHLQLAGSIALAATNTTSIQDVIDKYLMKPYNLTDTACAYPTPDIPQLAICMQTVGSDYAKFLQAQLTSSVLPVSGCGDWH